MRDTGSADGGGSRADRLKGLRCDDDDDGGGSDGSWFSCARTPHGSMGWDEEGGRVREVDKGWTIRLTKRESACVCDGPRQTRHRQFGRSVDRSVGRFDSIREVQVRAFSCPGAAQTRMDRPYWGRRCGLCVCSVCVGVDVLLWAEVGAGAGAGVGVGVGVAVGLARAGRLLSQLQLELQLLG